MIGQNDIMAALSAYNLPQIDRTIQQLMSVDPVLQQGYLDLLVQMAQAGLQPVGLEGFRDPARQDELFEQGGVTNARGGQSFHTFGQAMDIVPAELLNQPDWAPNSPLWQQMGDIVRQSGFTWGGDFSSLFDPSHVQAPGELGGTERFAAAPEALPAQYPPEGPVQDVATLFAPQDTGPVGLSFDPGPSAPAPDMLAQLFVNAGQNMQQRRQAPDDGRRQALAALMVPQFV